MTQADHSNYTDRHVERYHQEILNFQCVTQLDVLNSCISIKSNARGVDNIHPTFLKILLPTLLPLLSFLIKLLQQVHIHFGGSKQK